MTRENEPKGGTKRLWQRLGFGARRADLDAAAALERLEARYGALPPDFEAGRYVELYPDLAGLRGDPVGAAEHYLRWGRPEGRVYKTEDDRLEALLGQLPADFDPSRYVDLHADLESLRDVPGGPARHYLYDGRAEGRPYKTLPPAVLARKPVDLDAKAKPPEPLEIDRRDWRARFNPADFRALAPDLGHRVRTRAEALALFQREGVARLVPLSLDDPFDPDFYRARHPDAAALDAVAAYRHWIDAGIAEGRPGSEAEHVKDLLGSPVFPESFDWEAYRTQAGLDAAAPRWAALDRLVETGLAEAADVPVRPEGGAAFLEALAVAQWKRARRSLALGLLERALATAPGHARRHWTLAAWQEELGEVAAAESNYRQAKRFGYRSVFLVYRLAVMAATRGDFETAYAEIAEGRAPYSGYFPWTEAFEATLNLDFSAAAEAALGHYRQGERSRGDATLTTSLARITHALETLDDLPPKLPRPAGGPVVLFANQSLPQCRHYRVEQRGLHLDRLGIPYRLFDSAGATQARAALLGARALIVYREPAYVETVRLILHARALGVPAFYEIDDLIFDADHYPDGFEAYEKQIPFEDYVGLLYGVPLFRFAATLCDAGIASTEALGARLGPLTRSGACTVIPNGLDARNARFLAAPPVPRRPGDPVHVFYGSGTKAHDRNFNETAGPALAALMAARPEVRLVIVGYLELGADFAPFADRIRRFGFSARLDSYWAALSEADINLAVLLPGAMNDGKSEIKWLEAAASAVPSVVSATATYRAVLADGEDALLAATPDDWRAALFRLVDDPALRRRIGDAARARAVAAYGPDAIAARLAALLPAEESAPAPRRTRVLIVNVLFPPQTFGGATRVVRDNVDDLSARYGDAFDLAVYATDFDAPPGTARIGRYGAVPVFRYGRNVFKEFDYRDEGAGAHFAAVLDAWAPDLVHFHCIQFLTGTIVERCREAGIPYLVTAHDAWWISPSQFLVDDDHFLRLPGPRAIDDAPTADGTGDPLAAVDRKRSLADRLREAAAVTVVSESFAALYRDCGIEGVRVTSNGLSERFLEACAALPPRPAPAPGAKVRVGHIGGRSHHKGIHLFQLALEAGSFRNIEAVVIDHAEETGFERDEHWGTTPVTVRGTVPQDGVIDLYRRLDVLVAPSTWPESFGLVSREALALGLWVVASDLGALAEDVVEGENGFVVDVADARDLTRVLGLIDADPARFTEAPSLRFEPRPAARQTDEFVALYRGILAGTARPT